MKKPPILNIEPRTCKNHANGWKRVQECTSLSMSQVHFGHYMAGTFNPNIAVMNVKMTEMPITTGYAPECWKKGRNIMLQKQAGNLNVKKLRVIMLFEADFNMNNKELGRAIMIRVEQAQELAPEQYGSRKEKAANIQSLNKQLFYNTIQFN